MSHDYLIEMVEKIFTLLVVFQIKHFLCDYPLQTRYMLGKFKAKGWILPLTCHAAVHGLATALIAGYWMIPKDPFAIVGVIALAMADFGIHFTQDRIKASPNLLGRWKQDSPFFWWALGQDQMVHHLTHYWIIYMICLVP